MASQWIMQNNCLKKTHSCFQWSNSNISGKSACSVLSFSWEKWKIYGFLLPSIFPQELDRHWIIQEFRIRGSRGIQPRCSAGKGRFSFSWEGGRTDPWYGAAEPQSDVETWSPWLGSLEEVLGRALASKEQRIINCMAQERRWLRRRWCQFLGFKEHCHRCLNVLASARWMLALLSCVFH